MPELIITVILLAIAVLLAHAALRRFFYPRPTHLPQNVSAPLLQLLERLESLLRDRAPATAAKLRPGLSDREIAAIESRVGFRLTDHLRSLYKWHDGESDGEFIPGHRFVPLVEATDRMAGLQRELRSIRLVQRIAHFIFAGHRSGWLHVLDDRCGDGYFYDPARGSSPGSFFFHFAETGHYRYFPSLANFVAGVIQCYESGIYRERGGGRLVEDHERSHELWPHFAGSNH